MQRSKVGFVGGGNMASSLIGGLIEDGYPRDSLRASEPDAARRTALSERLDVRVEAANDDLAQWADVLLLAVKPQQLRGVLHDLAETLAARQPLVISIAAGVQTADILRWAQSDIPLIRVMPNTPALVKTGMSVLFSGPGVQAEQREVADAILSAVGETLWVDDEGEMDAVTAVSGSGPAYFFLMMEALEKAGQSLGLSADTARKLTLQTALGAARMASESETPPAELRKRVTSPGGTTERALAILEAGEFRNLIDQAVAAAARRAAEIADSLSRES